MSAPIDSLDDLEERVHAGETLTGADAERIRRCTDLVAIGVLGEAARQARHGNRVTYGRVCAVAAGPLPAERGAPGEVRLTGRPASKDDARARVRAAAAFAPGVPLTGFSLADLLEIAGGDHLALADLAAALRADGLEAVAEVPIDRLSDVENTIEVIRAVSHGGLGAWRAINERAAADQAIALAERAALIQRETGALKAFAPLARIDAPGAPSTGYDDVRSIAMTRLVCRAIPCVQVDWLLHGPKLAQVAIAFGADDFDAISALDDQSLGPRRAPVADIERQIRAAFAEPVERTGRFEPRA